MAALLRDGKFKTRKDHKCHGCREIIPKGTEVYSQAVADEGTVSTFYVCDECRDWCKNKKCRDCFELENAYEGHVKECMENCE